MERLVRGVVALAVAAALAGVVGALALAAGRSDAPVQIAIRHSAFAPTSVEVRAGVPVTFVLRNGDPIDHEWIVGDEHVHKRHRTGTEPVHGARPTEVSVAAGQVARTTVTFDAPGTYRSICHLPGHEAYGMVGTVLVRP